MPDFVRVTLQDIAAKLGVSRTTVSLALGNSHRISAQMREKVQQVADEVGYAPDPFLSGLVAYRRKKAMIKFQGTLAWIRYWTMEDYRPKFQYHRELWEGACKAATKFGYRIEEICWEKSISEKRFEQILLARGIHGILISPHRPAPNWQNFDWGKFSIIRFGQSVPVPDSNLVTPDSFRAVVMAVNKIHHYGYKKIGLAVGEFDAGIGGGVRGGFLTAQSLLGRNRPIPLLEMNVDRYEKKPKQENQALQKWLDEYRPDAILTTEAQLPLQLRDLGYRIPKDIAVAATNVHDISVDAGIDQHAAAVGQIAVEMLVKQINVNERGEPENPLRILVESRWQDGKSLPSKMGS